MTDKIDIAALRRVAESAPPGPWHAPGMAEVHDAEHNVIAYCAGLEEQADGSITPNIESGDAMARHVVAFDRETALALLDRVERSERRHQQPNEIFAIVRDRHYEGEGLSLAFWNGDNYSLSDGDCFERDGDTLGGWTAEWLTDHQLEKRLEQAEKDAARLDWLADPANTIGNVQLPTECVEQNIHSLRAAIDAAMAMEGK